MSPEDQQNRDRAIYELWDVEAGNVVGEYETEAAALSVVARYVDADDIAGLERLALVKRTSDGFSEQLVAGSF